MVYYPKMEQENIQSLERKLKKEFLNDESLLKRKRLPKSLRKYIRKIKSELRNQLYKEEEIKNIINEIIKKNVEKY
jgi:iron-sulfur cluster repair protein YtfE (RIC family)